MEKLHPSYIKKVEGLHKIVIFFKTWASNKDNK
jgi:hypothetical protein